MPDIKVIADIVSTHSGFDTYEDSSGGDEPWHVTCDGCTWDAVLQEDPAHDHALHVAELIAAALSQEGCPYEFGDEIHRNHTNLRRIRAIRDIPRHGVKAGDTGGFISSYSNLTGNAWVAGDAWVTDEAVVTGDAYVGGKSEIGHRAVIRDRAVVTDCVLDNAVVEGDARLDDVTHLGRSVFSGDADVKGSHHFLFTTAYGPGPVTVHRTRTGHLLTIRDVWSGTAGDLDGAMRALGHHEGLPDWNERNLGRETSSVVAGALAAIAEWEANRTEGKTA